jgi:hypothetical protein
MLKTLASLSAFLVASSAFAFDFSAADALFTKRGEGDQVTNTRAARQAYGTSLSRVSGHELMHAVSQMNRLDFFEGMIITDNEAKKAMFEACSDRTEKLDHAAVEYYYWKGVCLASWASANGILSSLRRSGEVESFLLKGRAIDPRFEGGGFDRVLAFVYLRVPPINPMGPTRDVKKALAAAESAIAAPAYPGEQDPSTATGEYFYNVYGVKAEILADLGRKAEGIATIQEAIERIEQGDLPVGREPETHLILRDLKNLLAELQK